MATHSRARGSTLGDAVNENRRSTRGYQKQNTLKRRNRGGGFSQDWVHDLLLLLREREALFSQALFQEREAVVQQNGSPSKTKIGTPNMRGSNDPLEELIRAVRTFPAPVIAMVHGSVWGGAFDLVLSCDVIVADETAMFAITPANLGLPYNTTGLLHFLGRLPINLIKELFFAAAPVDAQKAKEWLVINHLVDASELEAFTLDLAATMASKSPLAISVIEPAAASSTTTSPSRPRCTSASRVCGGRLTTRATTSRASTPSPRSASPCSGAPEPAEAPARPAAPSASAPAAASRPRLLVPRASRRCLLDHLMVCGMLLTSVYTGIWSPDRSELGVPSRIRHCSIRSRKWS